MKCTPFRFLLKHNYSVVFSTDIFFNMSYETYNFPTKLLLWIPVYSMSLNSIEMTICQSIHQILGMQLLPKFECDYQNKFCLLLFLGVIPRNRVEQIIALNWQL